jgi:S-adenosylmethionine hydrolase
MAIITFTSDFGPRDHYVASVKAKMLSINPSLNIVDISHEIEPCNIPHAFFVLRSCFRDFPKGTVHLVAVDAVGRKGSKFVALQLEDHYFLGNDNGLFSLISEKEPSMIAEIAVMDEQSIRFPTKEVLGKAAAHLASGSGLQDIGKYTDAIERKMNRTPRASKQQISGHVTFGREQHDGLHKSLNEVEGGECYVMFNSLGLLEIGINKGNACELLGLHYDSPVNIYFQRNG